MSFDVKLRGQSFNVTAGARGLNFQQDGKDVGNADAKFVLECLNMNKELHGKKLGFIAGIKQSWRVKHLLKKAGKGETLSEKEQAKLTKIGTKVLAYIQTEGLTTKDGKGIMKLNKEACQEARSQKLEKVENLKQSLKGYDNSLKNFQEELEQLHDDHKGSMSLDQYKQYQNLSAEIEDLITPGGQKSWDKLEYGQYGGMLVCSEIERTIKKLGSDEQLDVNIATAEQIKQRCENILKGVDELKNKLQTSATDAPQKTDSFSQEELNAKSQKAQEQYKEVGGTHFDKYADQMRTRLDEKTNFVRDMITSVYGGSYYAPAQIDKLAYSGSWTSPIIPPKQYQMPREYTQMKKAYDKLLSVINDAQGPHSSAVDPQGIEACQKDFENACAVFQKEHGYRSTKLVDGKFQPAPMSADVSKAYWGGMNVQVFSRNVESMSNAFDEELRKAIDSIKDDDKKQKCQEWMSNPQKREEYKREIEQERRVDSNYSFFPHEGDKDPFSDIDNFSYEE